jgi:hypothetical protein
VNIPAFQVVVGELKKDINSNGTEMGRRVAEYLGREWSASSCRRNGQAYKRWVINIYPNFRLPQEGDESFLRARSISNQSPKSGPAGYITLDVLIKISQFKSEKMTIAAMARELHISANTIRVWKNKNKERWDKL